MINQVSCIFCLIGRRPIKSKIRKTGHILSYIFLGSDISKIVCFINLKLSMKVFLFLRCLICIKRRFPVEKWVNISCLVVRVNQRILLLKGVLPYILWLLLCISSELLFIIRVSRDSLRNTVIKDIED